MTAAVALLLAALCPAAPARADGSVPLKGVDLYRSAHLTLPQVENTMGQELRAYAALAASSRADSAKRAAEAREHIEARLRELAPLAFARLTYDQYVTSAGRTAYITLDVVDKEDAARRMPFRAAPAGQAADPHGLLETWRGYVALGTRLRDQAVLDVSERPDCPGFYCSWGSSTPELANDERRFVDGARGDKTALLSVLTQDAQPWRRAAALYVLSYGQDGPKISRLASDALLDPAPEVRRAALDILSDIALYHKDVPVDVARVLSVLDYPLTSDREKAMSVLVGLADRPAYRSYITARAAPDLVRLLRLSQPSNHDLAFTLLAMLSQQSYDQHDYDAWARWSDGVISSTAAAASPSMPAPARKHGWL